MFATAMRHLQLMAFPKTVYNADLISKWDNRVGTVIGVHGLQPGANINQVAYNLQPAEMSSQIFAMIDKVMQYTKECLGATDAQMGNVKPDNTSALMVLQTNAEVPLENIRANLYEWVEDIGAILLDMMGTYYGTRPVIVDKQMEEMVTGADGNPELDPMTGMMRTTTITRRCVEEFDFSQFKHLWLNLRVDVGATTYFSEIAMTQTLDNLRRDGVLNVLQYLERIPDKLIPQKEDLIQAIKKEQAQSVDMGGTGGADMMGMAAGGESPAMPMAAGDRGGAMAQAMTGGKDKGRNIQGGQLDQQTAMATMPGGAQAKVANLPAVARRSVINQAANRAD